MAPPCTAASLHKLLKIKLSSKPDVRFLFPNGQVLYDHSLLLMARSAYLKTLLTSGFAEEDATTTSEAMAKMSAALPSDGARVRKTDGPDGKDWLAEDEMPTVMIEDFSYAVPVESHLRALTNEQSCNIRSLPTLGTYGVADCSV